MLVVRSQRLLPKRWANRSTKSTASGVCQTVSSVWHTPLEAILYAVLALIHLILAAYKFRFLLD